MYHKTMMSVKMMDEDIVCKSTAASTMFFLSLKDHSTLGFSPNSEICGWHKVSLVFVDFKFNISGGWDQN